MKQDNEKCIVIIWILGKFHSNCYQQEKTLGISQLQIFWYLPSQFRKIKSSILIFGFAESVSGPSIEPNTDLHNKNKENW
jgi:hypothetical protein